MHLEVNTMNDNPELNLTSNLNSSAHEPQPTRNVIDKLINLIMSFYFCKNRKNKKLSVLP